MEKEVNQLIKERRTELDLTLNDVAKALGVSDSTVLRYETKAIQNMGIDKIEALAKVLKCDPAYLMGWDKTPPPKPLLNKQQQLLSNFNKLNDLGQNKILEDIEDLTALPKYQKEEEDPSGDS